MYEALHRLGIEGRSCVRQISCEIAGEFWQSIPADVTARLKAWIVHRHNRGYIISLAAAQSLISVDQLVVIDRHDALAEYGQAAQPPLPVNGSLAVELGRKLHCSPFKLASAQLVSQKAS